MDRLDGIPGTDIEALKASGENLAEFAKRGANMYLEMVFRDGFYHSDPHPGNLMLLPGAVVGVVDCGQVGRIDDELRDEVESLLLGIVETTPLKSPSKSCASAPCRPTARMIASAPISMTSWLTTLGIRCVTSMSVRRSAP
jgi:ubiquinone biosynthesis protein